MNENPDNFWRWQGKELDKAVDEKSYPSVFHKVSPHFSTGNR